MVMAFPASYAPVVMVRPRPPFNSSEPEPGTLGYFVRQRRSALALTQQQLADRIADQGGTMDQADVSDIESNVVKNPRLPRMRQLSQALDVPLGVLYAAAAGSSEEELQASINQEITILPVGPDGEIVALVRRIPQDRKRQAIDLLRLMAGDDAS